ncbi:unnamed protein product [Cylicocyclus nassatus]|uniref:Uncharacterized protein n=1 Tax=Cylicocyclus nassatus TaxID=53992 RepID=A0AA36GT34_CYLNA|nr:unnamed protein product [Cylicocyclus nassatus]
MMLHLQDKLWLWTLWLLALPVVVPESPTFARLCDKPAQAGTGKLLGMTFLEAPILSPAWMSRHAAVTR